MAITKGGAPEARGAASSQPTARALNGSGELLRQLSAQPQAPVLILPTERDAKAFSALFRSTLALSATKLTHTEDLTLLTGRRVTLWLRRDEDTMHFLETLPDSCERLVIEDETSDSLADWIASGAKGEAIGAFAREHTLSYGAWAQRHLHALQSDEKPAPAAPEPTAPTPPTAPVAAPEPPSALPDFKSASAAWEHFDLAIGPGSRPWPNIDNIQRILAMHPQTAGRFSYDELGDRVLCGSKPWNADDVTDLTTLLQRNLHFPHIRTPIVMEAVEAYARQRRIHPVREYLQSLPKHDGQKRVEHFFSAACGAAESDYMRAVSRSFLVSAIARIYDPGCIVRTMPVLEGEQGSGKSTTLAILGGAFYLDNARKLDSKEFEQDIQGYWIVELSELVSMMKGSTEGAKAALSRRDDVFRASYGRRARPHPRSCVFAGTTNSYSWQLDETGGTRFLPVRCGSVDLAWTRTQRTQLWAEALALYRTGVQWWDVPQEEALAEQEARHVSDSWEETVLNILAARQSVTLVDLYDLMEIDVADRDQRKDNRLVRILERHGWRRRVEKLKQLDGSWRSIKVYRPPPESPQ